MKLLLDLPHLRDLTVWRLKLEAGQSASNAPVVSAKTEHTYESVLHVLTGSVTVSAETPWGGMEWPHLGGRRDVFAGLPAALYLGRDTEFEVRPETRTADLLWARTGVGEALPPALVRPEDVRVHTIGEGHYRRTVREVIGEGWPSRLRIGETINEPGAWSSWPMHAFEKQPENAAQFEECFMYLLQPVDASKKPDECRAYQVARGRYSDGAEVDEVRIVKHGDMATIPLGYHPVVAGPDCRVWYWWCYLSPEDKKYSRWAEDAGGYA